MKTPIMVSGACALALLALSACHSSPASKYDSGAPPEGSVERRYARTPDEVARAATEAMQELGMPVQSDQHDALGGMLAATRSTPGKEDVVVWYKRLDPRNTQVSVAVGKGDRRLAELVQDSIAQRLGDSVTRGMPAAGAKAEGEYDQPLGQCLTAAEVTIRDLRMTISHRESHDTWATIESRESDAIPILVKMERTDKDKTRVSFVAGTSKSQDTQQLAERVKAQFEQRLSQLPAVK